MKKITLMTFLSLALAGCFNEKGVVPTLSSDSVIGKGVHVKPVGFFSRDVGFGCLPQFLIHNNSDKDYNYFRIEATAHLKDKSRLDLVIVPEISPEEAPLLQNPDISAPRVIAKQGLPAGSFRVSSNGINLKRCPEVSSLEIISVETSRNSASQLTYKDIILIDKNDEPKYIWLENK